MKFFKFLNSSPQKTDLTSGNLLKKIILFSLPVILSSILQLLYTQCDLIILRVFGGGDTSVSAVGVNSSLINLIIGLFLGLSIGCNVVLGQVKGRNDIEYGKKVLHSSIILAFIFGAVIGTLGSIFAKNFLDWMNVTPDIIGKAASYLTIYFIGAPFLLIYNYGAAMQRALGNSRKPLFTLIVAGIFNVILNLIFVIPCEMGVAGVATATTISMGIAAIITILELHYDKNAFVTLNLKDLHLSKEASLEVLKIGIPAGLQTIVFSISNVFIQAEANLFGTASEIGNTAASNVENYIYLILNGIALSTSAFVAQNYGAKKYDNIIKILKYSVILEIVVGLIVGTLLFALSPFILQLFITNSPEGFVVAENRLIFMLFTYFTCGIMDVFSQTYRSERYTYLPLITTALGVTALRLIFIFTLYKLDTFHNLMWLYSTYPISWVITSGIYIILFKFIQKRVKERLNSNE